MSEKKIKIYVAHSSNFDFRKKLYEPLKKITGVDFIFPHSSKLVNKNSKNIINNCDLVLAEVSYPSHGVGIELGWANVFGVPVVFLHKKNAILSSSLARISKKFVVYDKIDMKLAKIEKMIMAKKK